MAELDGIGSDLDRWLEPFLAALGELWARAAIGPVPGQLVLLAGLAFHGGWAAVAVITLRARRGRGRARTPPEEDRVLELARQAA